MHPRANKLSTGENVMSKSARNAWGIARAAITRHPRNEYAITLREWGFARGYGFSTESAVLERLVFFELESLYTELERVRPEARLGQLACTGREMGQARRCRLAVLGENLAKMALLCFVTIMLPTTKI